MEKSPLACVAPRGAEYEFTEGMPLVGPWPVPYSTENPLVFHVLTQSPSGAAGEREALDMVAAGTALAPPDMRPEGRGLVKPRDEAAGDGRYVFLSPFNTFGYGSGLGLAEQQDRGKPAFAFDARALARTSGFAFRLHDAEAFYVAVESTDVPWDDDMDEDEWEALSQEEKDRRYEELVAMAVREDLECIADVMTITDSKKALEAVLLLAEREAGLVSDAEARRIAESLIPDTELDEEWCPLAAPMVRRLRLHKRWMEVLTETPTIFRFFERQPEILYKGVLPLCCAAFFRRASGEWVRMPEDVCTAGIQRWELAENPRRRVSGVKATVRASMK